MLYQIEEIVIPFLGKGYNSCGNVIVKKWKSPCKELGISLQGVDDVLARTLEYCNGSDWKSKRKDSEGSNPLREKQNFIYIIYTRMLMLL